MPPEGGYIIKAPPDNHANFQRHDDRLAAHAISTNLPCDVGMEKLLIGSHERIIASGI